MEQDERDLPLGRIPSRVFFPRHDGEGGDGSLHEPPLTQRQQSNILTDRREGSLEGEINNNEPSFILIDPHKINDFMRFRMIFVGMLFFINCSTQGLHALFSIYMEQAYGYDIPTMVDIFAAGTAFGLFIFPFGVLYDFFGPKIVTGIATLITTLSHLLFALTFAGHIEASKLRFCIFFAMMNWGCYAFDVATLPTVLTYAPRDRGQPVGLLKTFSGLGPSIISCLFRGFFNNRFDNLMYFLMAIVCFFGIIGTIFIRNAPYEITRWEEPRISLKERLRRHLIRNRYMSQLLPKRRLYILSGVLVLMNIYLSIQAVCAAYYQQDMTKGQYRGIAIGAIVITLLITILLVPVHALDGPTAQDERVIAKAREKERELKERREQVQNDERKDVKEGEQQEEEEGKQGGKRREKQEGEQQQGEEEEDEIKFQENLLNQIVTPDNEQCCSARNAHACTLQVNTAPSNNEEGHSALPAAQLAAPSFSASAEQRGGRTKRGGSPRPGYLPVDPDATLLEADDLIPIDDSVDMDLRSARRWLSNTSLATNVLAPRASPGSIEEGAEMDIITREISSYNKPHIETITVCGEVFVTPIYETTFLQSLTYVDLWLIFFTVFVVWGIGITVTANWNMKIMIGSVFSNLEYKTYILFATLSGVSTAFGRVLIGTYDAILFTIGRERGMMLPATIGFPVPSVLMTLSMIFYLSFPGNYSLIAVYMICAFAFGFSTSITTYVIGIIFKRDFGMHYGFCFLGSSLGIALLYRALFFGVYHQHRLILPPYIPIDTKGVCKGKDCMQKTLIVYLTLSVLSIVSSGWLHYRYWKLVHGKLKYRRVITRFIKKRLGRV